MAECGAVSSAGARNSATRPYRMTARRSAEAVADGGDAAAAGGGAAASERRATRTNGAGRRGLWRILRMAGAMVRDGRGCREGPPMKHDPERSAWL